MTVAEPHADGLSEPDAAAGPLAGVRVLDMTRLYPGPLCSSLLAGMGARVVKLEHPTKQDTTRTTPPFRQGRAPLFDMLHQGKKGLALDVTQAEGRAVLLRLLAETDVLIEGFRPGTMARNGLDYEALKTAFPRLVYVSLTGYGQTGPLASRAGHDLNYIAYAGLLALQGDKDGPPCPPAVQIADTAAGAYTAAMAVAAALYARSTTGCGQYVDVAMLDACLPLMTLQWAHHAADPAHSARGSGMLSGALPFYRVYRCADGRYVALAALEPKFWTAFCRAVDHPEWVGRMADPAHYDALATDLTALFLLHPRDAWVARTAEADCCLSPVLDMDEAAAHPQIVARGCLHDAPQGPTPLMPVRFNHQRPSAPRTPAPTLGRDTDDILAEAGISAEQAAHLRRHGIIA